MLPAPDSPEAARHVSLSEVAREAGVSLATASRVLNGTGRSSPEARRLVEACAARLGYQANPMVSTLMHQIRSGRVQTFRGVVVFVGSSPTVAAWQRNEVGLRFLGGATAEAKQLGYSVELLLPRVHRLDRDRLGRIVHQRGVAGALLAENSEASLRDCSAILELPMIAPDVLPVVLVGHKERVPRLNFAITDQYANARLVGTMLKQRGYLRPLLLSTAYLDAVTEERFVAGLAFAYPGRRMHEMLSTGDMPWERDPEGCALRQKEHEDKLRLAIARHKADAVVVVDPTTHALADQVNRSEPASRRLGLATLDWSPKRPDVAGVDQMHEAVGAMAMRQLAEQIQRGEQGALPLVAGRLVEGVWRDGDSLPERRS
jgi:DNA-binding LacI/PurR family transcriptional regulator